MPKFFADSKNINNEEIIIVGEDVNHIKNVLRKKLKDTIEVCEAQNSLNFLCEIEKIEKDKIVCKIIEKLKNTPTETNTYVHIYQGLPKADKMELIIQKSVELGVSEITPTNMSRCIVKLNDKDTQKKVERWQKISEVAAKQSGRDIIPKINNVCNFNDILNKANEYDALILAYENEQENKLRNEIENLKRLREQKEKIKVAVIIGPEGGIAGEEVQKAKEKGIKIVTLGSRILRTETVALNVLSIIMYELE